MTIDSMKPRGRDPRHINRSPVGPMKREGRMKSVLAGAVVLSMMTGSAMADSASFANDAVGTAPKG